MLVLTSTYLRARQTAQPFCELTGCASQAHPLMHEFSALDPALLGGMMMGAQRRPIADAYWQESDPTKRHGLGAETFQEFDQRVSDFLGELPHLPDGTVLFGHGIWFGLLCWKLWGFSAEGAEGMRAFRRFQRGLPMPNGAVYLLEQARGGKWRLRVRADLMRDLSRLRRD